MATNAKLLKLLSQNVTSGTYVDMYAPAVPKSALVTSISLSTSTAGSPAFLLKAVPSGGATSAVIYRSPGLSTTATAVVSDPITIGSGDKIQVSVVSGSTINVTCVVMGIERD